jgi:hypothetical protein
MSTKRLCMIPITKQNNTIIKYAFINIVPSLLQNNKNNTSLQNESDIKYGGVYKMISDKLQSEWQQCVDAKPNTLRSKFYHFIQKSKSKLDPHETLLYELNDDISTSTIEILYPSKLDVNHINKEFTQMLQKQQKQTTLYMSLYVLALPFTSLLSLLPLPNVMLAINGLRLYHLYISKQTINYLLANTHSNVSTNDKVFDDNNRSNRIRYVPFNESASINWLDSSISNEKNINVISEDTIHNIISDIIILQLQHSTSDNSNMMNTSSHDTQDTSNTSNEDSKKDTKSELREYYFSNILRYVQLHKY